MSTNNAARNEYLDNFNAIDLLIMAKHSYKQGLISKEQMIASIKKLRISLFKRQLNEWITDGSIKYKVTTETMVDTIKTLEEVINE